MPRRIITPMPYTIKKQKCKQADDDAGSWTLSYTDKKGKRHKICHTSKAKAKGQIAAIEMREELMRLLIREMLDALL